jgi:hypothetical protein
MSLENVTWFVGGVALSHAVWILVIACAVWRLFHEADEPGGEK